MVSRNVVLSIGVLLLSFMLLGGATIYYDSQSVVIDQEVRGGIPERGENFTFALDSPQRVKFVEITVHMGETIGRIDLAVNGETIESLEGFDGGTFRKKFTLGSGDIRELRAENTLSINPDLQFSTTLTVDHVRVRAPKAIDHLIYWTTTGIGIILLFIGLYLGGKNLARRYDREDTFRRWTWQTLLATTVIAVIGVLMAGLHLGLFLVLEHPLAVPQMDATSTEVQDEVESSLQTMYQERRNELCRRGFDQPSGCTVESMVSDLESREIDSYGEIDRYLRDASFVSLVMREKRLVNAPYKEEGFIEPVTRLLSFASTMAQEGILRAWSTSFAEDITTKCRSSGVSPDTCMDRMEQVFNRYETQWDKPVAVGSSCDSIPDYQTVNLTTPNSRTGNVVVDTFNSIGFQNGVVAEKPGEDASQICNTVDRMRPRTIRTVIGLAGTMSRMAIFTASGTTNAQEQTQELGDAVWREIG